MALEDFLHARSDLPFAACIVSLGDGLSRVFPRNESLKATLAKQNDLYNAFAQTTDDQPITRFPDDFPRALSLWQGRFGIQGKILLYPTFSPEQILEVADVGLKVAPGATRFGFPYRVTNLRVPLWLLRSNESTERKNQRLQAILDTHPLISFDGESFFPQGIDSADWEV